MALSAEKDLTFTEFFAGIGLVRMGLERAGWKALYANDIDPKKQEMYAAAFGLDEFELEDIFQIPTSAVPDSLLATASFPCIDLSLAGNRAGLSGDDSSAYWGFYRILKEKEDARPPLVLLENVLGLLTSNKGQDLYHLISSLNELGYRCDVFVLNAVHFTPQSRPRVFIIGALGEIMDACTDPVFRDETLYPKRLRELRQKFSELNWGEVWLPPPPIGNYSLDTTIEQLPPDSDWWWTTERVAKTLDQMSEKHRAIAEEMIQGESISYGTIYRRVRSGRTRAELRTDGIAGCLRTPVGGSSRQIVMEAGQGTCRIRFMTPREYARLQGVPDEFPIEVPVNQALYGFGDAVCVPAIEWIARHGLNSLVKRLSDVNVLEAV